VSLRIALVLLLVFATGRSGEGDVRLLTDEAIPRYLARGQQLARSGEWAKMIDILQRVIVGDKEIFPELDPETLHSAVHTTDGVLYYPARELCMKELSNLPPEGLAVYRATYDVPAAELMKKAAEAETLEERLTTLTEVFDTYLVSSSGDDALERAADLHLRLGHYFECLALLRRLLDVYPSDTDRDLAMARTKAAYCAARIGDGDTRNSMLERLAAEAPGRRVLVEGKPVAVEDLPAHPVMEIVGAIDLGGREDWPMAGGDPTRHRLAEDLPSDLPRKPFWRFGLGKRDARYWAAMGRWITRYHDRDPAVAPAEPEDVLGVAHYPTVRPVVHDGLVFYKDYLDLVARRLGSGEFADVVAYPRTPEDREMLEKRKSIPVQLVRPGTGTSRDPTDTSQYEAAYRWYDYGGNDVVVTSRHIVVTSTEKPPGQFVRHNAKPPPNLLLVSSADDGRLIWGWGRKGDLVASSVKTDPARKAEWARDRGPHQNAYFRGPGVVSGGILYTLVEERDSTKDKPGGVAVWAMRMRDGKVLYRTQLHHPDDVRSSLPAGASLSIAGATVYVLSNAGVLSAVDALPPGRIKWIRRYPRGFGPRARGAAKRLHIVFAHNEPVVAGGKVVILPVDSNRLQAIDAETGRLDWELEPRELGDVRHVVGVRNQTLVLAGSSVTAVDLQRGKVLWSHESIGAPGDVRKGAIPYGRGFLSDKIAYVPAVSWHQRRADGTSYIHRFDIETGDRLEHYSFDVPRLGNILCIDGRLIACNEDEVLCFTTPEHERKRIAERLEAGDGSRAALLLERALVNLRADPKTIERALEDLREAATAAAPDTEAREIHWRTLELLLEKAQAEGSTEPLAEARRIAGELRTLAKELAMPRSRPYLAQIAFVEAAILADAADAETAIDRLQALVEKHADDQVRVDGEILAVPVAARRVREQWMEKESFRAVFETVVRRRIEKAVENRDKRALAVISQQFGAQPPAEEAWFALAKLHLEDGEPGQAEEALRTILRDFPGHARQAEAHLKLAVLLARKRLLLDARIERDRGLALLDGDGRTRFAEEIAELRELLPDEQPEVPRPTIELPLRAAPFRPPGSSPIPVVGAAPEPMQGAAIVADGADIAAVGTDGTLLWRTPNVAGAALRPGEPGADSTALVASAVANARLARWVGGDLLIGDVFGVQRIDPRTGNVVWQQPASRTDAAEAAAAAVEELGASLGELAKTGHLHRTSPLPAHVLRAGTVIRVDPKRGVFAYSLDTGAVIWEDTESKGAIPGAPSLVGQLLAVGRVDPGAIDIFDVGAGRLVRRLKAPREIVLAAPRLDRLGRVFVIAASDTAASEAAVYTMGARDGERQLRDPVPVHSRYAAILHADESLVVLHDGTAGGDNLHFLEIDAGKHTRIATEDISRTVHAVRDGPRLFVFTHKPGLADEGARLFRVDLSGRGALRYERPPARTAYGRPLLTSRYIGIAGSDGREASVCLYEREASKDLSPPAQVFPLLGGQKMTAVLSFQPAEGVPLRFDRPPALAAAGPALVVGHPFGIFRLQARDTR